jgi:transcriptional regulator with XRE-family HTH domain
MFGSFISSAREKGGWPVEQTAELAGMDAAEWAAIEAGTRLPNTRPQLGHDGSDRPALPPGLGALTSAGYS